MNIINPVFKIQNEDRNIFTMRALDYKNILPFKCQQASKKLSRGKREKII